MTSGLGRVGRGVDRGDKILWGSATVSLAAHALFALGLLAMPAAIPRADLLSDEQTFTLVVQEPEPTIVDPIIQPPPPELPPPPDTTTSTPPPFDPQRTTQVAGSIVTPQTTAIVPETPIEVPTVIDEPRQDTPPELRRDEVQILIDPRRVAMGAIVQQDTGPTVPRSGTTTGTGTSTGPLTGVTAMTAEEAARVHADHMHAVGADRPHTRRHAPIRLVPQSDGSYVYAGPAFTARVAPDGSVTFEDRPAVQTEGFSTSGSFDLTDMVMGASGQDPLASQREDFMEETEAQRAEIERAYRERSMRSSVTSLRGRLASIWQDEERTAAQRRRALFDEWDDADDGTEGDRARRMVLEFIRTELPASSDDAYTEGELRVLNMRRQSRAAFAPYE